MLYMSCSPLASRCRVSDSYNDVYYRNGIAFEGGISKSTIQQTRSRGVKMEGGNGNYGPSFNDFGMHDFINDANFDHYIDLMRGGNIDDRSPAVTFNHNLGNNELIINNNVECFLDYPQQQYAEPHNEDLFGFNDIIFPAVSDPNSSLMSSLPSVEYGGIMGGDIEGCNDSDEDGDDSSGTTMTTNTTTTTGAPAKKGKADRTKTLVSEQKRRGRMKEKLYALRALVPNITKMDKASIVGDAVLYVQQLQTQAKKLKTEIAGLESSLTQRKDQNSVQTAIKSLHSRNSLVVFKFILQMDIFQVEESGFYVRLVSNKGEGVAISLYKAIESLTGFSIQSSNLATQTDRLILTFTMNAKESRQGTNLPNLKLWIGGALLNQGFEFKSLI